MEDDLTPYELGSHAGMVLRYAIIIVAAVALFRLLMRSVKARTLNAVLGALAIYIVFAVGVVKLAGEQFGRGDTDRAARAGGGHDIRGMADEQAVPGGENV